MQSGGLLKDLTIAETARYTASPFVASRPVPPASAVVNVVVWPAVFAGGAMWRFRKDTARV